MIRSKSLTMFLCAGVILIAGCTSSAERRQMESEELAAYTRHAGAPVDQIRSFRLISWQPVSDRSILLEARLNEWYLIDVSGPCMGLPFAHAIGVENSMNALQARFDNIIVEGQPCRIETIRPVDYKAAREEIRAARAAPEG